MKEILKEKLKPLASNAEKYNALREHLQLLVLRIIDEKGFFQNIAFVGGTALRILYDLNRFSEDLDFCLIKRENYSFDKLLSDIKRELNLMGLPVDVVGKDKKTVAAAFIKFNALLYEFELSSHKDQNLTIKLEIDQSPPLGYATELTVINKIFLIGINHYDRPSLFASKLHAILCRQYQKGRDYYDFIWYMSQKITPNLPLLNNAIEQTEGKNPKLDNEGLKQVLIEKINATDFNRLQEDVRPFLADPAEIRFFKKAYFLQMVETGFST